MLVAEIAPGFTSGFISGAPVPTTVLTPSMAMIELKRAPVASTPMRFSIDSSALLLDHLGHREDLRDRLDRHLGLDVAGGVDLAVGGDERDAEQVRIDLGERRDVVGVLAFLQVLELRVGRVDRGLRRRLRPAPRATGPSGRRARARARPRRWRRVPRLIGSTSSLSSELPREVVLERELDLDAVAVEAVARSSRGGPTGARRRPSRSGTG